MKTKITRFSVTAAAIVLGILLVLGLTFMGETTSGPIEDVLNSASSTVANMEKTYILSKRKDTRPEKLKWFDALRNDKKKIGTTTKILYGAFDNHLSESFEKMVELEDSLHTTFSIIQMYVAWGNKTEQKFPTSQVQSILAIGSIPLITWEPWLNDFDMENFPKINPDREKRNMQGLKSIARGDFDSYIDKWATELKRVGKPVFLRLGHEMNDPYRYPWGPQNNKPADFVAAWKHVNDRFKAMGATNAIWVWSPHPAYKNFDAFYPGDAYVDWVGVGVLNYGTVAPWSKWWTFDEIFGNYYAELSKYKKPIMISEFGCLSVGGNRSKWFSDALTSLPVKYPAVKSVVFFNHSNDNSTTYKALNWTVKDDAPVVKAIINSVASQK